jgi:hypothetical protein
MKWTRHEWEKRGTEYYSASANRSLKIALIMPLYNLA